MTLILAISMIVTVRALEQGGYFNLTILYSSDIFSQFHKEDVFFKLTNLSGSTIYVNPGNVLISSENKSWDWYLEFVNSLPITALGLSWFKDSPSLDAMESFLKGVKHPILTCNLNVKNPSVQKYLKSSSLLQIGHRIIGILGYISEEKRNLYLNDDDLGFSEEIESTSKECLTLRSLGARTVIALGFSDFLTDLRIAETVECVDVIVGSNSELFSWRNESIEVFEDRNPVMVQNFRRKIIPVTQRCDGCIGEIRLVFDENGILSFVGELNVNENYKAFRYSKSFGRRDVVESSLIILFVVEFLR